MCRPLGSTHDRNRRHSKEPGIIFVGHVVAWSRSRVVGVLAKTHMGKPIHLPGTFALPFKYHAEHRHRVPKARYRVTNWAEYDASMRQRGSLTIWFTDEAIEAWRAEPRTTPGGQPHYSSLAISTALTMVSAQLTAHSK